MLQLLSRRAKQKVQLEACKSLSLLSWQQFGRFFGSSHTTELADEVQLTWPPPFDCTALAREAGYLGRETEPRYSNSSIALATSTSEALAERQASVKELMKGHGLSSASFAKSNLTKLPVKTLRTELLKWGVGMEAMKKPELVGTMQALLTPTAEEPNVDVEEVILDSEDYNISPTQVARWLEEAKADDVRILDVRGSCEFCDYMVLATARSHRHIFAAAMGVSWRATQSAKDFAKVESGVELLEIVSPTMEGGEGSDWILVNLGTISVHVFSEDAREYYDLEGNWWSPLSQQVRTETQLAL